MEGMIRRFNKDKLNGRISLPEFLDELTPKCSEKLYWSSNYISPFFVHYYQ